MAWTQENQSTSLENVDFMGLDSRVGMLAYNPCFQSGDVSKVPTSQ